MISTLLKINKKSPSWINFSFKFKQNKKTFIMLIILQLISLPLFLTMAIDSFNKTSSSTAVSMIGYTIIAIISMAISILLGITIATNTFAHLHKKSIVDMDYSLPISIKDRFFSSFLSGLSTYTIPYIGAMILSLIINAFGLALNTAWNRIFGDYTGELIKLMIVGFFIMLFVYTLSVFITTCCGTLFESIAYIFIINILIPSSISVFFLAKASNLYGISIDQTVINAIKYSSPIGGLTFAGEIISEIDYGILNVSNFFRWIIIYSLVIVGVFILTYMLYKKRRAEDVSKPFVYNFLYYIIVSLITFNILMVVTEEKYLLVPLLIFSGVVYLIFDVVKNRGFKKIHMTAVRYGITAVSSIALSGIISATNFFGIEYYVPLENMVKSITFESFDGNMAYDNTIQGFTTDNPKVITALIKAHEDIIDNFKEDTGFKKIYDSYYYDEQSYYISFTYNMKTGNKSSREYRLTFEQMLMLSDIYLDDSYIDKTILDFRDRMGPRNNIYSNGFNIYSKFMLERRYYTVDGDRSFNEIAEKICRAYKKDLKEQTMEDVLTPEGIYGYINDFPIRTTNINTIAVLEEYRFIPYTMEEEFKSRAALNKYGAFIYKPVKDAKYTSTTNYAIHNKNLVNGVYIDLEDKEVMELLKVAQPIYTTTDSCYMVTIDNRNYVIPLEYSDLAKEVYEIYD